MSSNYVYPDLPLIDVHVDRERIDNTSIYESPSGAEQRVSWYAAPRYRYRIHYDALREYVAAPSPWDAYSELGVLRWFLDQHRGPGDSFLFNVPGEKKNLLAYSQDFSQAVWTGYYLKPGVTAGKTAPDGTATACEFASADYGSAPLYTSGVDQAVASGGAPDGPITVSIWARVLSGTLACYFGTRDGATGPITLTTAWQRFTYTDTAWTFAAQSGRIMELFEQVQTNAAWQVWGAQAEPASSAGLYVPTGASPIIGQVRVRFEEDSLRVRRIVNDIYEVEFNLITVTA